MPDTLRELIDRMRVCPTCRQPIPKEEPVTDISPKEYMRQRAVATKLVDDAIGGVLGLLGSSIPVDDLVEHYGSMYMGHQIDSGDLRAVAAFVGALAVRFDNET